MSGLLTRSTRQPMAHNSAALTDYVGSDERLSCDLVLVYVKFNAKLPQRLRQDLLLWVRSQSPATLPDCHALAFLQHSPISYLNMNSYTLWKPDIMIDWYIYCPKAATVTSVAAEKTSKTC